jgi:hypothetical protein
MREASVRKFQITPSQYELFRFNVAQPTTLYIQMMATAPVNLLVLDSMDRDNYESGRARTYAAAWGRRSDLEGAVNVDAGTWYLVVEGSTEPSTGRIKVFQDL